MSNPWNQFPVLAHLPPGAGRELLERRRRHRQVRYLLFRLQNQVGKKEPLDVVETPPGFIAFWLGEKPLYKIDPTGRRVEVPSHKLNHCVADLGGYASFAKVWDVDDDLYVYLRHRSVWAEWNLRLQQVVPVLGHDD